MISSILLSGTIEARNSSRPNPSNSSFVNFFFIPYLIRRQRLFPSYINFCIIFLKLWRARWARPLMRAVDQPVISEMSLMVISSA